MQMSPLADAERQKVWRARSAWETEPCVLEGAGGCPEQVLLCSFGSSEQEQISMLFRNTTQHHVRAIWIDLQGNEVPYTTLKPGTDVSYRTFPGHPWIFREIGYGRRMCCNGAQAVVGRAGEGREVVTITEPPLLPWTAATHKTFSAQFQEEFGATLLCYSFLNNSSGAQRSSVRCRSAELVDEDGCREGSWCLNREELPPAGCQRSRGSSSSSMQPAYTLGSLPQELLVEILRKLVPPIWQDVTAPGNSHPDVLPCAWADAAKFAQLLERTAARQREAAKLGQAVREEAVHGLMGFSWLRRWVPL